jgi:Peptidase family S41/N-terminal domain of Peptidase_S41 in eukaryotic IRBP
MLRTIAAASAAILMALGMTPPAAAGPAAPGQLPAPAADAGPARPAPDPAAPFDAAARHAIVAEIAKAMRDDYVEPDVGARAAAAIEIASGAGAYDALDTRAAFAGRLTADLAAVAHDKHLAISDPGAAPPGPPPQPPPASESGVVRADRLAGNIGYIEIVGFPPPVAFKAPLDRAMAALADTRALVINMRRNGGGHPLGVAYLVSFFVDGRTPVHIMDILWRKPGTSDYRTDHDFTTPTPTAYLGKPVYVLTSARTFSGGEEFCYDMQTLKRAVLVGETTGGGANPGGARQLGAGLVMFLPMGKGLSPITGANWEGVGVKPDIAVPADQALKVALEKLGEKPPSRDIAALSKASLFHLRATPLPGAEAALRRMIETTARGQPDYDQYGPGLAEAVRSQLPAVQARLAALGPIQSVTFRGPSMIGGDSFEVKFANGALFWSISLTPDGKIGGANFTPAPPPTPAHPKPAPAT